MISRSLIINVVLVRSLYDSNVGASSRAMANMGVSNLILIAPQCEITYSAQQAAATGQEPLANRKAYPSWESFFASEPEGLRIAFTARDGKGRQVEEAGRVLKDLAQNDSRFQKTDSAPLPVYLIFGPEDWGLAAQDLELAHHCVSIPTYGDNSSLNLAQAVLLGLFILRTTWGGQTQNIVVRGSQSRPATTQVTFPDESLKKFLLAMGFSLDRKKTNVHTVFRRMLLRTFPTTKELRMLEIIFEQGARKLIRRDP